LDESLKRPACGELASITITVNKMTFESRPIDKPNETLPCPDCGGPMALRRNSISNQVFFACWGGRGTCSATCPAHQDGTPDGVPADRETRNARKSAWAAFMPLSRKMNTSKGHRSPNGFENAMEFVRLELNERWLPKISHMEKDQALKVTLVCTLKMKELE
jgi:hypothetical protein